MRKSDKTSTQKAELKEMSFGALTDILNNLHSSSIQCSESDYKKLMAIYSSLAPTLKGNMKITRSGNEVSIEYIEKATPKKEFPSNKKEDSSNVDDDTKDNNKQNDKKIAKDEAKEKSKKMDKRLDKDAQKKNKKTSKEFKKKADKLKNKIYEFKKDASQKTKRFNDILDKKNSKLSGKIKSIFNFGKKKIAHIAPKAATKSSAKITTKILGKATLKSTVKKIPFVSLAAGCAFAASRIAKGDWKGALGEVTSGALGCIPGVGTVASLGIDTLLTARDIHDEKKNIDKEKARKDIEQKTRLHTLHKISTAQTIKDIDEKYNLRSAKTISRQNLNTKDVVLLKQMRERS